jgi:hypothetical protein
VHGDAAVQQFSEAIRDILQDARVWVPGSNWDEDSIDEIARYWYQRDPERAVQVATALLELHRSLRRRASSGASDADIELTGVPAQDNVVPFNGPTATFGFRRGN